MPAGPPSGALASANPFGLLGTLSAAASIADPVPAMVAAAEGAWAARHNPAARNAFLAGGAAAASTAVPQVRDYVSRIFNPTTGVNYPAAADDGPRRIADRYGDKHFRQRRLNRYTNSLTWARVFQPFWRYSRFRRKFFRSRRGRFFRRRY